MTVATGGLTQLQQRVYDYVAEHPGCTSPEIRHALDPIASHIHEVATALYAKRLLHRWQDERLYRWRVL